MKLYSCAIRRASLFALLLTGLIAFSVSSAKAQGVPGGTQISNRVSINYTEPTGSTVNAVSNTVTVTVTNVTGFTITPDGGTPPGVNGGQSNVLRSFVMTNTGNITISIQFGAAGASLVRTGAFNVTQAFVDMDGSGAFNAGDINILSSTGPVSMAMGTSRNVIVVGDVPANAAQGTSITLTLGDAAGGGPSFDNRPKDASAGTVGTVGSTGINGDLEARGDMAFTIDATGNVLIGPNGQPAATGPTSNNDDYTNRTLTAGIDVPFGGTTTAGGVINFTNTIRNGAAAVDQVVVTAPTVPAGYTVEVNDPAAGGTFTTISGGGSLTVPVAAGGDHNIIVRVTAPSGITVLTGYSSLLRARSGITPQNFNETIDRVWTGFIRADKSVTVTNGTGIGGPTDAVPGAILNYSVVYTNLAASSGSGNADLTATNVQIVEDGNAAPNNWGTTADSLANINSTIAGTLLLLSAPNVGFTYTIASLTPGQSGTLTFTVRVR